MDDSTERLIVELARLLIYAGVSYMSLAGKKPEEVERAFNEELERFNKRKPFDLPDV